MWDDLGDPFMDLPTLQAEIANVLDGKIIDDAFVPEPATVVLMSIGTVGVFVLRRNRIKPIAS
jgi:hypothetical protein